MRKQLQLWFCLKPFHFYCSIPHKTKWFTLFSHQRTKNSSRAPSTDSTHVACNMYAVRTYFFRLCWFTHFYRHGMIPAICSVNSLTLPNIIGVLLKNINVLPTFKNMSGEQCFLICPSSGFGKHG